jgi:hypothetical protein
MGLKSTVKPIVVITESKDTTPSVTPMRPTPLVGKWCDLPWPGEDLARHQTPKTILEASLFLAEAPAPMPIMDAAEKKHLHSEQDGDVNYGTVSKHDLDALSVALCRPIPSDEELDVATPPLPTERAGTAEPSSDDGMEDLYLATPMDTFAADDFEETDVAPSVPALRQPQPHQHTPTQNYSPYHYTPEQQPPYEEEVLPSNASEFVDFRRLRQQHQTLVPPYQLQPAQPVYYQHQAYQQTPQFATVQIGRPHGGPSMAYAAPPQAVQQPPAVTRSRAPVTGVIVLISRFPPPPPPARETMNTMLRTGCSFDAYYRIMMRWYARVVRSVPKAHPHVPLCPPAESYLHDFDGWVVAIEQWWAEHFARRPRRNNNGEGKKRQQA